MFWLKYLCFLDTPICVFFSNLGQFLEINIFLTQYYNGKGKKICTSAIRTISQEPHECGKLFGVQIFFVQKKVENGLRIINFHKKCYFTHFWPNITTGREKRSALQLYHPYHKNLTSVASYLGSIYFKYKTSQKMASESLFFTKSAILPISDPILQREGKKRSGLQLYHPYHNNLTSLARYLWSRSFE